jgi:hypothetical protein
MFWVAVCVLLDAGMFAIAKSLCELVRENINGMSLIVHHRWS